MQSTVCHQPFNRMNYLLKKEREKKIPNKIGWTNENKLMET